jgi:hypothetical protein
MKVMRAGPHKSSLFMRNFLRISGQLLDSLT